MATAAEDRRDVLLLIDGLTSYSRGVLRGIARFGREHPRHAFVASDMWRQMPPHKVRQWRGAGIIVSVGTPQLAEEVEAWRGGPVVNVSENVACAVPQVICDSVAVGRVAAGHLLERGFARFAFAGYRDHLYSQRRKQGFVEALETAGAGGPAVFEVARGDVALGRKRVKEGLQRWVRSLAGPVGVLACNDILGREIAGACARAGLRVPHDVSIVGVDNDDLQCEFCDPPLSSVAQPTEQIGYRAAELMESLLTRRAAPPGSPVLIPPAGVVTRRSSNILAIEDAVVSRAMAFIEERAADRIQVSDVAEAAGVSRRSLERRFEEVLRRTPWEEIRRVQVDRAKSLLSETDLPVRRVAELAGFRDFRHMAVAFREDVGRSPGAYRRQYLMG